MKNVLVRLKEYSRQANGAEQHLIHYMLEKPEEAAKMSVQSLAERTYTSSATVIRLCQKLGFSGYKEMISCLNYENGLRVEQRKDKITAIHQEDSLKDIADKVTYRSILALKDTKELLDLKELEKCVELLGRAQRIGVFGIGSTLLAAKDMYMKLMMLDRPCIYNEDMHAQIVCARKLTEKDGAVIFGYSGTSQELLHYARILKARKVPVILVSRFVESDLTLLADYLLYFSSKELQEGTTDTAFRISQMNITDILLTAYVASNPDKDIQRVWNNV